jgi:hypothetical protein
MKKTRIILALLLELAPVSGFGKAPAANETAPTLTQSEKIPAGHFEWQPEKALQGGLAILVSLPRQMLYVYRGSVLIARSSISSGRVGRSTPSGSYRIRGKEEMHHSNLYDNAPMPFMQRLTDDGVALHAGYVPDHPASHGCIRLPREFAQKLFKITACGDPVIVVDKKNDPLQGDGSQMPSLISESLKQGIDTSVVAPDRTAVASVPPQQAEKEQIKQTTVVPSQSPDHGDVKKTMTQLEDEEIAIRNDPVLTREARRQELLRIWSEQRGLMQAR